MHVSHPCIKTCCNAFRGIVDQVVIVSLLPAWIRVNHVNTSGIDGSAMIPIMNDA